jgi:asparagine synthase (glutamine-hydrolysing)
MNIGSALDFEVNWINKFERERVSVDQFPDIVARNFEEDDALPNYGNIFDDGGNALARDARHASGWLAASGGCGEIYRNFFYLPDRPVTASAVARTFFARYTLRDVTTVFDKHAFIDALRDKILSALGREGDFKPLPRGIIEHIYPRIRCRALFGKEISMEARRGAYFMPFLNHRVVNDAMTLPMGLKDAGRFEAMLINAIDPELARQPSAYGHSFDVAPTLSHRRSEWSTRVRPIWLRERSYALQRRLRPMSDEHGGNLDPVFMGTVIDLELPAMRPFFEIDAITDSGMWRRLACLQYLAERLGSKLVQ